MAATASACSLTTVSSAKSACKALAWSSGTRIVDAYLCAVSGFSVFALVFLAVTCSMYYTMRISK